MRVQSFWDEFATFYPCSTPFLASADVCAECLKKEHTDGLTEGAWRNKHDMDRKRIKGLERLVVDFPVATKAPALHDPPRCSVLVPGAWARAMRDHLSDKERVIPPFLNTRDLLCDHSLLRFNPVPADFTPFPPYQSPYDLPGTKVGDLALCDLPAWKQLVDYGEYFMDEKMHSKPIRIQFTKAAIPYDSKNWSSVVVRTDPEPCPECVLRRIETEKRQQVTWESGFLSIKVLMAGEPVPDLAPSADPAAAASSSSSTSAASSRPRRTTRKVKDPELISDFETQVLSSEATLLALRHNIFVESNIAPGQQEIFLAGRLLSGDERTLADLEVPQGAVLYVRTNFDGDADTSALFQDEAPKKGRRAAGPEAGFAGTALSSAPRRAAAAPAASATAAAASGAASSPLAPTSPSPSSASSTAAPASSGGTWVCTTCTFENLKPIAPVCDLCGNERVARKLK